MPSVELVETTTSDACSTRRTSGTTPSTWQAPSKRRAASSTSVRHGPSPATSEHDVGELGGCLDGEDGSLLAGQCADERHDPLVGLDTEGCPGMFTLRLGRRDVLGIVASVGRDRDRGRSDPVQAAGSRARHGLTAPPRGGRGGARLPFAGGAAALPPTPTDHRCSDRRTACCCRRAPGRRPAASSSRRRRRRSPPSPAGAAPATSHDRTAIEPSTSSSSGDDAPLGESATAVVDEPPAAQLGRQRHALDLGAPAGGRADHHEHAVTFAGRRRDRHRRATTRPGAGAVAGRSLDGTTTGSASSRRTNGHTWTRWRASAPRFENDDQAKAKIPV